MASCAVAPVRVAPRNRASGITYDVQRNMGRPRSRIARERKPVALVRDQPASAPVAYATEAAQAVRIGIPGSMATGRPESRRDSSAYRISDGANTLVPV